ncbi:MAG TPA: hypothetical protein VGN69_02340 [Solirubrobacteraceae bacterium]|jgi:hypothetical protein|nr:hypothetical protein [Solirubrobacteraceae bacterium]
MPGLTRLRAVPWAMALEVASVAHRHWKTLSDSERSRLARLLRESKGNPRNLTARERSELARLVSKLDVPGIGRDLLPFAGRLRGRR